MNGLGSGRPSWRGWALAGGLAALLAQAVGFLLRLALGVPVVPELFVDAAVALLPAELFSAVLDRLLFWGKPLLLAALIGGEVLLGALVGVGYGRRWPVRPGLLGRNSVGGGLVLGLVLWLASEALRVALGEGGLAGAPATAALLASGLTYGLALAAAGELAAARPVSRRRRLLLAGLAGGALVVDGGAFAALAAAMVERPLPVAAGAARAGVRGVAGAPTPSAVLAAPPSPTGAPTAPVQPSPTAASPAVAAAPPAPAATAGAAASPPLRPVTPTPAPLVLPAGVSAEITPNDAFYRVSKNFADPRLRAESWSLELSGLVKSPRRFSYDELKALPTVERFVTLECISNPVGGELMGNARWTGVPLARLLTAAGLDEAARFVVFRSADNYYETLPLEAALDPATLLVHTMNGERLSQKHGFPLRVILPGRYGVKNPKWLTRIEVAAEEGGGYWPKRGWHTAAPVQSTARIDTPTGETPLTGPRVPIGGVAFAGDRGVSQVEVSVDDGRTWRPAQLKPPLASTTWALWGFVWEDPPPGERGLVARAVDGTGAVQTAEERPQLPDGAAGYHRVRVRVGGPGPRA